MIQMKHRNHWLHKSLTLYRNAQNEWKEALINAGIMAGFAFFTTLAGVQATALRTDPVGALLSATIAAGLAFFARLIIERGLKKSVELQGIEGIEEK